MLNGRKDGEEAVVRLFIPLNRVEEAHGWTEILVGHVEALSFLTDSARPVIARDQLPIRSVSRMGGTCVQCAITP